MYYYRNNSDLRLFKNGHLLGIVPQEKISAYIIYVGIRFKASPELPIVPDSLIDPSSRRPSREQKASMIDALCMSSVPEATLNARSKLEQ